MSDLETKLRDLLSSQEGIDQVLGMAQSLGFEEKSKQEDVGNAIPQLTGLFDGLNQDQLAMILGFIDDYRDESDRRFHMLYALREYVKPEDVLQLEKAKQIVKLTKVAKHSLHSMYGRGQSV